MNNPLFDFDAANKLEREAQHLAVELGRQPGMGDFATRLALARQMLGIPANRVIEQQEREAVLNRRVGAKHRATQSRRRKNKPADDPGDVGRDERLRAFHARLVAAGVNAATSDTAAEFGLSSRRVRQILEKKDP